jgi:hypothetical protein
MTAAAARRCAQLLRQAVTLWRCSGRGSTAALGTSIRAPQQRAAATWQCCSGRGSTAALGTGVLAAKQRAAASWQCCSGRTSTAAPGTARRAVKQQRAATWQCCSGRGSTAARGTRGRAGQQPRAATWQCCSGRGSTAARGTTGRAPVQQPAATLQCFSGPGSTGALGTGGCACVTPRGMSASAPGSVRSPSEGWLRGRAAALLKFLVDAAWQRSFFLSFFALVGFTTQWHRMDGPVSLVGAPNQATAIPVAAVRVRFATSPRWVQSERSSTGHVSSLGQGPGVRLCAPFSRAEPAPRRTAGWSTDSAARQLHGNCAASPLGQPFVWYGGGRWAAPRRTKPAPWRRGHDVRSTGRERGQRTVKAVGERKQAA